MTEQAQLSIINSSKFPHPADSKFQLKMVLINRIGKVDEFFTYTMLIRMTDNKRKVKEKHIFNYGRQYKIDGIIDNDFITIEEWTKNQDSTLIQISILFKRISNGHIIQIFDLQARSFEIREAMINNLTLATLLYNETIELVSPSKLQLTVNSTGGDNVVLVLGQLAVAKCRSYDGIPVETPNFTNLQHFKVVNRDFVDKYNEIEIMFRVQQTDHLKHLNCSAGRTHTSMMIKVLPKGVIIDPPANKILGINRTISCYPKDGYPPDHIQWNFIEIPANPASVYEVLNKGKILCIKADAPTEVIWRFNCFVQGEKMINETISFNIRDKYCSNVCMKSQKTLLKLTESEQVENIKKSVETLKETQTKQNYYSKIQNDQILEIIDQINQYGEILKESSKNQLKIQQELISNLTEKYNSIIQQKNQEIDEIKNNLNYTITATPDFLWTISGISQKMKNRAYLNKYFLPGRKIYEIWFLIHFRPDKLQVYLDSYKNNPSKAIYPLHLDATIAVINTDSPKYYKVVIKSFVLVAASTHSPDFTFTKDMLADVLTGDSITIKFFLKFK